MSAYTNAQHVLQIYADRVEASVLAFKAGDVDLAFATLRRMNEAFHNFKVIESRALNDGLDPLATPDMLSLWQRIAELQNQLAVEMELAKSQSVDLLTRIADARKKVASFHSGHQGYHMFEKSV
jgi:hypothetical protein